MDVGNWHQVPERSGKVWKEKLMQKVLFILLGASCFFLIGCATTNHSKSNAVSSEILSKKQFTTYWPHNHQWKRSSPEQQGVSSTDLLQVFDYIQKHEVKIHSIHVVRNGVLILDAYFYPFRKGYAHDMSSVTKSVTSLLMGIALDQEQANSEKQKILNIFPSRIIANRNDDKEELDIQNLLTMTSGLDCEKDGSDVEQMRKSSDWIQYVLDLPMVDSPGTEWNYCSRNTHLLSGIITQKVGVSAKEFAMKALFSPIGIKNFHWESGPKGITHGWGDLSLVPLDALRIGHLVLNNGRWKNRQIVSSMWVEQSYQNTVLLDFWDRYFYGDYEYGYGWWKHQVSGIELVEARGRGGQLIAIAKEKNLVFVLTGAGIKRKPLVELVLKSVKSEKPLVENKKDYQELLKRIHSVERPIQETKRISKPPIQDIKYAKQLYEMEQNPFQLQWVSFDFTTPHEMKISLEIFGRQATIPVGLDNQYRFSKGLMHPILLQRARGEWVAPNEFVVDLHEISRFRHLELQFTFSNDKVLFKSHGMVIQGKQKTNGS